MDWNVTDVRKVTSTVDEFDVKLCPLGVFTSYLLESALSTAIKWKFELGKDELASGNRKSLQQKVLRSPNTRVLYSCYFYFTPGSAFVFRRTVHALPMMKMYMCDVCVVFERTSRVLNQFNICLLAFQFYCNFINSTFLKKEIKQKWRRGVFKQNFISRLGLKYVLPSFVNFQFFYKIQLKTECMQYT